MNRIILFVEGLAVVGMAIYSKHDIEFAALMMWLYSVAIAVFVFIYVGYLSLPDKKREWVKRKLAPKEKKWKE